MCCVALASFSARAQVKPEPPAQPTRRPGEIALAPSRLELVIPRGGSQTVVVSVISSGGDSSKPIRLLATLGDWDLTPEGKMTYGKPGTVARSAADWMIYSPVEVTVRPGETHPIRVTIDVPKDAEPGDHRAVLFVEERPPDLKTLANQRRLVFHFRLAAIFYVKVPPLETRGALSGLEASVSGGRLHVTPVLENEGNTILRPVHSFTLRDADGKVVSRLDDVESYPVLAGSKLLPKLEAPAAGVKPGPHELRYRVDFKDGRKVIEGRKKLQVGAEAPPAAGEIVGRE